MTENLQLLVENLGKFKTLAELERSSFFADYGTELRRILETPEIVCLDGVSPRLNEFIRVAQWNIEKGCRFDEIVELFGQSEILRWADVVLLNEVDFGMARSGNRQVARDLARILGMHAVFGGAHFELTKGTGSDLHASGKNAEGLQGNAILSRYPVEEARVVVLPTCFEPYHFEEKRYGSRNCVWSKIRVGTRSWWFGSVHLEVRNSPRCRARQVEHILRNLPGSAEEPYLLAGDLNTNGFGRGTLARTLGSVWYLVSRAPRRVSGELLHPEQGREPLFEAFSEAGFLWRGFNNHGPTSSAPLNELEDARFLPDPIRRAIETRLEPYGGHLHFKLDWILARKCSPLLGGERREKSPHVSSVDPGSIATARTGGGRISDHSPIYVDLRRDT